VILGGGVWSAERARSSACWRSWLTCESRAETLLAPSESEEAHRIAGRNERGNWIEKCEGGEITRRRSEEESCNISFTTNTIRVVAVAIDQTSINYKPQPQSSPVFCLSFSQIVVPLPLQIALFFRLLFLFFTLYISCKWKGTLYTCLYIYK